MKLEPGADPATIARVLKEIINSGRSIRTLIPGHGVPIKSPDLKKAVDRFEELGR